MRHNLIKNNNIRAQFVLFIFVFCLVLCPIDIIAENSAKKSQGPRAGKKTTLESKKKSAEKKSLLSKEYSENDFKPVLEEDSYMWLFFKTVIILSVIVGGFYYFFRFVTKRAGIHVLGEDVVQVLAMVPVGQNKYLQIVDLAGRVLVLGVSDNSINLVTEITEKEQIDRLRLQVPASLKTGPGAFQEYLTKSIGKVFDRSEKKGRNAQNFSGDSAGFDSGVDLQYLKKQKNRLKKMKGFDDE